VGNSTAGLPSSSSSNRRQHHGGQAVLTVRRDLQMVPSRLTIKNNTKPLGTGGFSVVVEAAYRFNDLGPPRRVALKVMNLTSMDSNEIKMIQREIECMQSVAAHANVVNLIAVNGDPSAVDANGTLIGVALMLDLAQHGSLRDLISSGEDWPWDERYRLLVDTARGVNALHCHGTNGIIHRDLKSMVSVS
jgi:serine/threonine protein kinase